jgi:hypothetical protein
MESPRKPLPGQAPTVPVYSLLLGVVFALAWLGYTAVRARDGREPITDWLDPMLAGTTLIGFLLPLALTLALWPRLPATRARDVAATGLVVAPWLMVLGEVLSNTITIGEPPEDIGGLLEMAAGGLCLTSVVVLAGAAVLGPAWRENRRGALAVTGAALLLAAGMGWWFTHPIDQSGSGAPACVPGNPVYNTLRGDC